MPKDKTCIKTQPYTLFLSHSANLHGAERSFLQLIKGFTSRGGIASVILPEEGPLLEELKNIPVGTHIIPLPWWATDDAERKDDLYKELVKSSMAVTAMASRLQPDIIYTNTSVICQGAICARTLGIHHQWHIHEYGEIDHGLFFLLDEKERANFIYETSDSVIFNSEALSNYFHKYIPNDKSYLNYYYIEIPKYLKLKNDKQHYYKKQNSLKLLLAGQIHVGKGQIDAIKAVKLFRERVGKDIELIILGAPVSKEYHDKIIDYIKENELEAEIIVHNFVNDPYNYFTQADIVLMCSRSEAFGRVTVEAMLMGKPVIGTNRGGTKEIIEDGVNGFFYEPGNEEELFNKLDYFYKHRDKILEMGLKGKSTVEKKFTEEGYAGRIYERQLLRIKKINNNIAAKFISDMTLRLESNIREIQEALNQKSHEVIGFGEALNQKSLEVTALTESLNQKSLEITGLTESLNQKSLEITGLTEALNQKSLEVKAIETSRSFRLTKPLRDLRRCLDRSYLLMRSWGKI